MSLLEPPYAGTKVGADGRRYPAGEEPVDYDDFRPQPPADRDPDIVAIANLPTTAFGRSLLTMTDADALGEVAGGGGVSPVLAGEGGTETVPEITDDCVAWGMVQAAQGNTSTLDANGVGSFAGGYLAAWGPDSGSTALLKSDGNGSVALGYSFADEGGTARVYAQAGGDFAMGKAMSFSAANPADVHAWGNGAFAMGYAKEGIIYAGQVGSLAFGYAPQGTQIRATAAGAVQFGPGTNAAANSLQVGNGPRLFGNTAAPTVPRNGDIWVAGTTLYAHSAGTTAAFGAGGGGGGGVGDHTTQVANSGYSFTDVNADALAFGKITAGTSGSVVQMRADGPGALAFGQATASGSGYAYIEAPYTSSVVGGRAYSTGSGRAYIDTFGVGTFTFGYATAIGTNSFARINAADEGSLAMGYVRATGFYGQIKAENKGSIAFGYARALTADAAIRAETYEGAFALGWCTNENIIASKRNSFQLGPGNNNQTLSIAVGAGGSGIRINGAIPTTSKRNGDIWVDGSGNIVARSGGADVIIA